ncbi:MAG TPA: hypothetical protein VFM46_05435, partial [Pseudomonadales bacterium]|nr:hypothetical protein [Pseudomonadales bacterium]
MFSSLFRYRYLIGSLCFCSFFSASALADDSQVRFGGFLNQALINTSDNQFFGHTDQDLSTDFWEAGLLLGGNLTQNLELSSVLLARRAGQVDDGHPRVDQFLFTYHLADDFSHAQGFRVGRTKQRFGIYNQTRDVPFTRPGILLPQSTYLDRERNTLLIVDDLSYYYEIRSEQSGTWHFDFAKFKTQPSASEFEDFINYDVSVD